MLAHVCQHLTNSHGTLQLVPRAAQVYCQLAQYDWLTGDSHPLSNLNDAQRNSINTIALHSNTQDYEAVDVRTSGRQCVFLSDPVPVLAFDFSQWKKNMQPAVHTVPEMPLVRSGVCNAVVLFFDLHLDRRAVLTTSPHDVEHLSAGGGCVQVCVGWRRGRVEWFRHTHTCQQPHSVQLRGPKHCFACPTRHLSTLATPPAQWGCV